MGIGIASAMTSSGPEFLMATTSIDPTCCYYNKIIISEYNAINGRWYESHSRMPFELFVTTKPSMVFKPESTHNYGGWYMLIFRNPPQDCRNPPDPSNPCPIYSPEKITGVAPMFIISDGNGNFLANPKAHIHNEWTQIPFSANKGVGFYVTPWNRVIGAYIEKSAGVYEDVLKFLPFADGIIRTEAKDHRDGTTIRAGLCFSLRGKTNSNCYPPGVRTGIWEPPDDPPVEEEYEPCVIP